MQMLLALLIALCAAAQGVRVAVEAYDLENALLARQEVEVAEGASGADVMQGTKGLGWKFTKVTMGAREVPVVTEIAGLKASMPVTAWVLSHRSGDSTSENVAMGDVRPREGDVLHWRFWSLSALAAATKAKAKVQGSAATPTPTAAPAPAEEEDEDASDAEVLARERQRGEALAGTGPQEQSLVEEDGEVVEQRKEL